MQSKKKFNKIDLLIDNPNSWMWDYVDNLKKILERYSEIIRIYRDAEELEKGDILFVLSCDRILGRNVLDKHMHNIVVHESDLPHGKGWSPLTWQVENGLNKIPVTLFEASENLDSGSWYIKDVIDLKGSELIDEIRHKQVEKTFDLIERFLKDYPLEAHAQKEDETFFPKRTHADQEIDVNSTIGAQFNKLRVCDNERYPAYFSINGNKYLMKIYKA